MNFWNSKKVKIILVLYFFIFMPFVSDAKDYDYYVDGSISKSGDGSKEKPFKTIIEAVEKGGDVFIEDGKYDEDIELKKKTGLFGESENGVIVSGKIIMDDDTRIQDLTVRGVKTVIMIRKDADADIENCTIKDFGKIGILAVAGSGKLKVSDSKIINGDGKGFYIERGKVIELLNNEVTDNDEEGIDIRSKVKGTVSGNLITKNRESGIELIVGSSNLQIENNVIKRNGASGIATQFYPDARLNGKGQININDNSIGENKKYGLDCNRPQGGVPGVSYWKDSIELAGNNIYANKMKSINDYCNLIDAVDEDEKVDNAIEDAGYEDEIVDDNDEAEPELTEEEKIQIELEEEEERQFRENKLREIELLLDRQGFGSEINNVIQDLENESVIKIFFVGVDLSKIDSLLVELENREQELERVQILMEEVDLEAEEEIFIQESLENFRNTVNQQKEFANDKIKSFSVFGWFRSLF